MHGVIANIDHASGTQGRLLRRLAKRLGLIAAVLVIAGAAVWYGWSWWTLGRFMVSTDDAYVGGEVTTIGSKVAGFIDTIAVTDNELVKAGDLLVKLDDWGWEELLVPQAFRGFAQQFTVAPIVTLTLGMLPPERLKSASGLFNLMRNLGGAIGIAVCGTILNDRTNLHLLRIAEHLTTTNTAMENTLARLADRYNLTFGDPLHAHAAAVKKLWVLACREAQVETFAHPRHRRPRPTE